jgi:hypothetical protein
MTYASRLRAKLDPKHTCNQSFGTPKFTGSPNADEEAELKFTGGFDTRRKNRCPRCFITRSANGTCNCE